VLSLLRTPRWISFTALLLLLIVASGLLSRWQWSRAESHRLERIAIDERANAEPVPIARLVQPATPLPADLEWRQVSATGIFTGQSALVRKRPLDGQNGFWVMSALALDDGSFVWVNRGWTQATGDALGTPSVAPPPAGPVAVIGRLRPSESGPNPQPKDLPPGQVTDADISVLPPVSGPEYDVYLELVSSNPDAHAGLILLSPPEIDDSRNISYAVQWLLFAAVGIVGWYFFLRREARTDATAESDQRN
jgi:cytochrome oxidase assembly protein ShyY1